MTRSLYRVTAVDLSRTASDPPALQVPCRSFRDLRKCFIIIRVTRLCCRNSAVGQEHAEGSCTALEILSGAVQFLSYRHETLGSEDGEAATVFHLQPLSTYVLSSKHTYRFRCCVISEIRVDRPTDRHPRISQVPPQHIPPIEQRYVAADPVTPYKSKRHSDQIKEDEMGGPCGTNVGEESCLQDVNGEI